MHEHLVIGFSGWHLDPTVKMTRQDELAVCIDHIEELKAAGYRTIVDPCPNDMGRDVDILANAAARTGFNVVCATGFFNEHSGGNAYWRGKAQIDPDFIDRVADLMIGELIDGIPRIGIRPGIIKIATGQPPMSDYERKIFAAAAKASLATGAPITTHTDAVLGDVQIQYLMSLGVAPNKVIIGHSCGNADHDYHMGLVEAGTYVGFDRFGVEMICSDEVRTASLLKLLEKGAAHHVIISHDCVWCLRGNLTGGKPFEDKAVHHPLRFERFVAPKLRASGISQDTIEALLTENPRRYFAGEPM
jgi:phosphotriesterase-related protein